MPKSFLQQVADHYWNSGDIEFRCFIFPNRRAASFFRRCLSHAVASDPQAKPFVLPPMISMMDFFYRISSCRESDKVSLLLKLYDSYSKVLKSKGKSVETLEDFLFWGDIILSDFDDVDKYLADPKCIFTNVSDFKQIASDPQQYLSPRQLEVLNRFSGNFIGSKGQLRDRYLRVWDLLYPLYKDFNQALSKDGLCYEGMAYRRVAESDKSASELLEAAFPNTKGFVFVGLNALNECEKTLLRKMSKCGLAEFCWDYCSEMITSEQNCSSHFMKKNLEDFPQAFEIEYEKGKVPELNVIPVPSSVAQAKLATGILLDLAPTLPLKSPKKREEEKKKVDWLSTAIVLPDEKLLPAVLSSIPYSEDDYLKSVDEVNVTMGCNMSGSSFVALLFDICSMQLKLRYFSGEAFFHFASLKTIFASDVLRAVMTEEDLQIIEKINSTPRYYIPASSFKGSELLELIFSPATDGSSSVEATKRMGSYLLSVVDNLGVRLAKQQFSALELSFAKRCHQIISLLSDKEINTSAGAFIRLLSRLISTISVPFDGDPLNGLQIMGPLETRALDFDNIIVLSMNEGMFPRHSVSSSFIPPELRRGFELPTYEHQDAMWAYYFYRMIQRANRVWLMYDSRTEGTNTGEESRYIKQLKYQFGVKINYFEPALAPSFSKCEDEIPKTEEMMKKIEGMRMSASSLNTYETCPARFYFQYVEGLKEEEEASDSLDAAGTGTVFHNAMMASYLGDWALDPQFDMADRKAVSAAIESHGGFPRPVTRERLKMLIADKDGKVSAKINALICAQSYSKELSGLNVIYSRLVKEYVKKTFRRDLEYLEKHGLESFTILGLELEGFWKFQGHEFHGYIDRLDEVGGKTRVVDYKTGKVDDAKKKASHEQQLFFYDMYVLNKEKPLRAGNEKIEVSEDSLWNSIYSVQQMATEEIFEEKFNPEDRANFQSKFETLFAEMENVDIPFKKSGALDESDYGPCSYCPFTSICLR